MKAELRKEFKILPWQTTATTVLKTSNDVATYKLYLLYSINFNTTLTFAALCGGMFFLIIQ
jgi:hypothetical protein